MSKVDYKDFYNRVGKRIGWDFSSLKVDSFGEKWDFYEEVVKIANKTDILLDIGTGGGERILKIANNFLLIVGIDSSTSMIQTARKNLKKRRKKNVRFVLMEAEKIKFPDEFFDLVSTRHCGFHSREVFRVLKKGGHFFTQQVSEGDKLNIKEAFGRGQDFGEKDGKKKKKYVQDLKKAGFKSIKTDDYNATEYYKRPKDLIFLLKHTPIIPDFGKNKKDFKILEKFIEENTTRKGIKTNSKRYMIEATN